MTLKSNPCTVYKWCAQARLLRKVSKRSLSKIVNRGGQEETIYYTPMKRKQDGVVGDKDKPIRIDLLRLKDEGIKYIQVQLYVLLYELSQLLKAGPKNIVNF